MKTDKRSRAYTDARYWWTDQVRDRGIESMRDKLADMAFMKCSHVEKDALRDVIAEYEAIK